MSEQIHGRPVIRTADPPGPEGAWYPSAVACRLLGIAPPTLRARRAAGTVEATADPWARQHGHAINALLYMLLPMHIPALPPASGPTARASSADDDADRDPGADDRVSEVIRDDRQIDGWHERDGYIYDGDRDLYIVHCPELRAPFVRSGEWVRSIWSAYTGGATIAEVCRTYELDHRTFNAVKRALSLTKTRAPWTDEELASRDADELFTDALRAKEREVLSRVERRSWERTKRDAERWRAQHESIRETVSGLDIPRVSPVRVRVPDERKGGGSILVGLTDMHVGKRAAGRDHTLAEQVAELEDHIAHTVESAAARWGVPSEWVVIVGSDALHYDTPQQTTTRGTPQGAQGVGDLAMCRRAAVQLYVGAITQLAAVAPVRAVVVPGNHDRAESIVVGEILAAIYAMTERVVVDIPGADDLLRWVRAGDNGAAWCLHHGDSKASRRSDIVELTASTRPEWADYRRTVVVSGHLHATYEDRRGLVMVTLPSPARSDDWHVEAGYIGAHRCIGMMRHDGTAPPATEYVPPRAA